jgi:D-alanyl-D-alanine carboxypeptidase
VLVTASSPGNNTYASNTFVSLAANVEVSPPTPEVTSSVTPSTAVTDDTADKAATVAAAPAVTAVDPPAAHVDTPAVDAPAATADTLTTTAADAPAEANKDGSPTKESSPVEADRGNAVTDNSLPAEEPVMAALEMPKANLTKESLTKESPADLPPRSVLESPTSGVESTYADDECFVIDTCVDRFLFLLYQRTPKEDSIREQHQQQVTVKKKGKLVKVTRTTSTVVDEDFGWKDGKAANKAGMSLMEYVIGGVDRDFKLRLFQMLHAAEQAGMTPGITSGFRDDYRQSIASGLKAANDRSFHGGSFHGGYGHGLAADIVSVKGATRAERLNSSQLLWKWVDDHGTQFGLGRPYLDRDPPHVAPSDGDEYVRHRGLAKSKQAATPAHQAKRAALRGRARRSDHPKASA